MYKPQRDSRFYYVDEAITHIEELQCKTCIFREEGEYPMCLPISGQIITEQPVEEINDIGSDGLVCTKYRSGEPTPPQVIGQETLF